MLDQLRGDGAWSDAHAHFWIYRHHEKHLRIQDALNLLHGLLFRQGKRGAERGLIGGAERFTQKIERLGDAFHLSDEWLQLDQVNGCGHRLRQCSVVRQKRHRPCQCDQSCTL